MTTADTTNPSAPQTPARGRAAQRRPSPGIRSRRVRRLVALARTGGSTEMLRKIINAADRRLGGTTAPRLPIMPSEIRDSRSLDLPQPTGPVSRSRRLHLGWVCTPPALGSGGHTTMFRMIAALEAAGHRCTIFLFDVPGGLAADHEATIRTGWPRVRAQVLDATELGATTSGSVDAAIATSWESAHVLASYGTAPMRRLYFVQDFEPMFYPRGTEYQLALDSYRFGFHIIALGRMIKDCIAAETGAPADVVPFGCDTSTYHLIEPPVPRQGVVWYARPENPRRGYWLARLALAEFHQQHRDVPIFVYGSDERDLPFRAEVHPHLTPEELNLLYNRVVAGLSISFTNVSLVPTELMRAGAIPVVNDSPEPRAVLDSPFVEWAFPSPTALADALGSVLTDPSTPDRSKAAAGWVDVDWSDTEAAVVATIENDVYGLT